MTNSKTHPNTVFLLGAGASHGYAGSTTGINPPLATNFFSTFNRLLISADFEVRIGDMINYLRDTRGLGYEDIEHFNQNIEDVFAEVHDKLGQHLQDPGEMNIGELHSLTRTHDQFIFWFAHVLNETQNGTVDPIYTELINRSSDNDVFITFNWDTLLDRALAEQGDWFPDDGYNVDFHALYDRGWRRSQAVASKRELLKLHGSTNWLGPYLTIDFRDRKRRAMQDQGRSEFNFCVIDSSSHYDSYKDRWRPGYDRFSFFFPPNDPVSNVPLMPILIPPARQKDFSDHPNIFPSLWKRARMRLQATRRLVIIGYSFPATDGHAFELLEAFLMDDSVSKLIEIVDPYPSGVHARVEEYVRGRCEIIVHPLTLSDFLGLPSATNTRSEYDVLTAPPSIQRVDSDARLQFLLEQLVAYNLEQQTFDVTTFSGDRFLNCSVSGEFATHLQGAYREEHLAYRLKTIPLSSQNYPAVHLVSLDDIWILQPLPDRSLTPSDLEAVDLGSADQVDPISGKSLREMVRDGYHCTSDAETEVFLRRVLAATSILAGE